MSKPALVELIQLHERKWGEQQYPGRPTLDQLLNGYVLAVWLIGKRFIFSVHRDAQELNDLIYQAITGKLDDRKLARVFINRIELDFRIGILPIKRLAKVEQPVKTPDHKKTTVPLTRQPDIVPLTRQPKLTPLPPQPNKRHGQNLPGRHVELLPGRKVRIRKGNNH